MTVGVTPSDESSDSFDRIALDLQNLRHTAGPVSYAELVRRIAELRLRRGVRTAAATPARSTVYNSFKTGRARLDPELLRDIVLALGATPEEADGWVHRCREARRATESAAMRGRQDASKPLPAPALHAPPASKLPGSVQLFIIASSVVLNLLGLYVTGVFKLSVYLDMVGTAIAAMLLGPWHGIAVAIASNSLGFLTGDNATIPFTPVNIVGALVWGYGIRKFRMGADLSRFVSLNLLTAAACSLVAAPIVAVVFHGGDGHISEQAVLSLEAMQVSFLASVFSVNIVTSITDKLLTGFIALGILLFLRSRAGISMPHMPLVEKLGALSVGASTAGVRVTV